VAVKSSSGECNITIWLLINLFILLVKHGGRVVLSVSNRNQFVLSVTQYSRHNKWENLANANMKYLEVQKMEDWR